MNDASPDRAREHLVDRVLRLCAAGAVVAAIATIWLPPIPPCQDAPGHITSVRVLLEPAPFAEWLTVKWAPTAQAFHALAFAWGQVVGVFAATKLALTTYLLLQIWAFRRIARTVDASVPFAIVGACAGYIAWGYAMGFFNYLGAFALGAAGIALWVDKQRPPIASVAAAVLFALAGWAHIVVGVMVLTHAVALDIVARRPRVGLLRDAFVLAPAVVLGAFTVAVVLGEHQEIGAVEATAAVYASVGDTLRNWVGTGTVAYSVLGYPAGLLLFGAALVTGLSGTGDDYEARLPRASAIGALVWSACFFVLPFHGVGWHFASPRVLFFVFATPAAFAALSGRSDAVRGVVAVAALVATGALVHGVPNARAEGARIAQSVERFGDEPIGRAYLVTYAPEAEHGAAPYARPNIGTGRYAIWHGGADPGQFAFNAMRDSVSFARPMLELFPRTRSLFTVVDGECLADPACAAADAARADAVAAAAVRWDSVVLVEAPQALGERLVARGFVASAPAILRPRPSSLEVQVELPSVPPPGPVVFRAGYPDTIGFVRGGTIPAERFSERSPRLQFDALPAGPLAVEVFVDIDGDGAPGPSDAILLRTGIEIPPGAAVTLP